MVKRSLIKSLVAGLGLAGLVLLTSNSFAGNKPVQKINDEVLYEYLIQKTDEGIKLIEPVLISDKPSTSTVSFALTDEDAYKMLAKDKVESSETTGTLNIAPYRLTGGILSLNDEDTSQLLKEEEVRDKALREKYPQIENLK